MRHGRCELDDDRGRPAVVLYVNAFLLHYIQLLERVGMLWVCACVHKAMVNDEHLQRASTSEAVKDNGRLVLGSPLMSRMRSDPHRRHSEGF